MNPSTLWYLLTLASITSPLSVWFFLPFLRGQYRREDGCYGMFYMGKKRFMGFCGARGDDAGGSYQHVELDTIVPEGELT